MKCIWVGEQLGSASVKAPCGVCWGRWSLSCDFLLAARFRAGSIQDWSALHPGLASLFPPPNVNSLPQRDSKGASQTAWETRQGSAFLCSFSEEGRQLFKWTHEWRWWWQRGEDREEGRWTSSGRQVGLHGIYCCVTEAQGKVLLAAAAATSLAWRYVSSGSR